MKRFSTILSIFVLLALGSSLFALACQNASDDSDDAKAEDNNDSDDDDSPANDDDVAFDDDVIDDFDDDSSTSDDDISDDDNVDEREVWCNEIAVLIKNTCGWTMTSSCQAGDIPLLKIQIASWCDRTNIYDPGNPDNDNIDHFWKNLKACAEDSCNKDCFDQNIALIIPYDPGPSAPECAQNMWRWYDACEFWMCICDKFTCYPQIPEYQYLKCQGLNGNQANPWECEADCAEQSCASPLYSQCVEDCDEPPSSDDDDTV